MPLFNDICILNYQKMPAIPQKQKSNYNPGLPVPTSLKICFQIFLSHFQPRRQHVPAALPAGDLLRLRRLHLFEHKERLRHPRHKARDRDLHGDIPPPAHPHQLHQESEAPGPVLHDRELRHRHQFRHHSLLRDQRRSHAGEQGSSGEGEGVPFVLRDRAVRPGSHRCGRSRGALRRETYAQASIFCADNAVGERDEDAEVLRREVRRAELWYVHYSSFVCRDGSDRLHGVRR